MERRVLIAILLSFVVVFGYQLWLGPPQPKTGESAVAQGAPTADSPASQTPAVPASAALVGESAERDVTLETPTVAAVFTNRGGRLKSWKLKKYRDHDGEAVELVSTALDDTHPLPLSLRTADTATTTQLNGALYTVSQSGSGDAPGVVFEYRDSNGLSSRKTFTLGSPYAVTAAAQVTQNEQAVATSLVWGPGLGDKDAQSGRYSVMPGGLYSVAGKVSRLTAANVAEQDSYQHEFEYVGIDDHYFASFALHTGQTKVSFQPVSITPPAGSSEVAHQYMGYTLDLRAGEAVTFYVGPKDFKTLEGVDRGLTRAINFGWFSVIVVPLLNALNWIYAHIVPNYGWAVAILTLFINLVLFPLNHKSVVSMRKMQEIQPEAKAIQERYAKLKTTDPARQKMNQELMALYRERGVNPASGCVPILLTLPVFLAFYNMLQTAIELRGAPFIGWIHDLSAADPYYVLPFLVGGSQLIQTLMTPQAGADPAQQKMMLIMPVVMSFLFVSAPAGALIYWLVGNLWRIGQIQLTNYMIGPPNVKSPRPAGDRKMKRVGSGKTEGAV